MSSVDFISKPLLSGSKKFLTLYELEELNVRLLKVEGGKEEGDDEEGKRVAKELQKLELYYEDRTPVKPKRTEEEEKKYRARIESLKIKAEQREYAAMTSGLGGGISEALAGHQSEQTSIASEMNKLSSVTAIATNMILAPLTFGFFLYFFVSSRIFDNRTYQILCSIVGGIGMLFVEMTLFVLRSNTLIDHDEKERVKGEGRVRKKINRQRKEKEREGKRD
ncbi:hypothetical protein TrLO_g14625 [Triparma laevis f. longispina]|uniref:Uncharacterized protein n=1 Tax=Triparma laevis f. longispina TaxID=1714387 RepID=A0A9W7FJX8_9STRA|nr:hypothetical protein TrLO_g14625 [Triparma laevis f. longispina]